MRKAIFTAGIDQVVTKYSEDGPVRKVVLKEATIDTESSIALERLGRETVRVFIIPLQSTIEDLDELIYELQDRRNNARAYIQDVFGSKPKEQQLTIGDLSAADPAPAESGQGETDGDAQGGEAETAPSSESEDEAGTDAEGTTHNNPDLNKCRECPCFAVNGCSECKFNAGGICTGDYPMTCTQEDCIEAKMAARGEVAPQDEGQDASEASDGDLDQLAI